jgi:hypothetical protein
MKRNMSAFDQLISTITTEIQDVVSPSVLLPHVPKFVSITHSMAVPGSEKRTQVLAALHTLVAKLTDMGKITSEMKSEMDTFIDQTVPATIDAILAVVNGQVSFASAEERKKCVVAFLPLLVSFVKSIVSLVTKKSKAAPVAVASEPPAAEVAPAEAPVAVASEAPAEEVSAPAETTAV